MARVFEEKAGRPVAGLDISSRIRDEKGAAVEHNQRFRWGL
jgi:hypothetical protein